MTARLAVMVAMSAVAMQAAAEPSQPVEAPSEELLEYLGTWNGDDEWLHSDDLLPPTRSANREPATRQEQDRVQPRDPPEQAK
jgi:hypothetical protein